jgi:hypothetical protein
MGLFGDRPLWSEFLGKRFGESHGVDAVLVLAGLVLIDEIATGVPVANWRPLSNQTFCDSRRRFAQVCVRERAGWFWSLNLMILLWSEMGRV